MILVTEKYQKVKEKTYVAPCIRCGCDDINIDVYEDKYGDIITITCKNCKNETKKGGIVGWNNENDIDVVLSNKIKAFENLKVEISELKKLKNKRRIS